jgi:Gti1/Pac2 family transcription factor
MRRLGRMSTRPDIMGLDLPPHIFRFSDFRMPPRIDTGPNGLPMIV